MDRPAMMRVLSVASECAPLIKTGGLADVVGALPHALAGQDVEMRVLLPGYPKVTAETGGAREVARFPELFGGPARILSYGSRDLPLLILDAPHLYDREGGIYGDGSGSDWDDNARRFAALSLGAAYIAQDGAAGWRPDLVHCHDWQAGFAPYYLHKMRVGVPSVMTVHNMAFAGLVDEAHLRELKLQPEDFHMGGFEFWGRISALKAGLVWSDKITTVSPTYARELAQEAFGMGFDGLIRQRQDDLVGILNGIDTDLWNPAADIHAPPFRSPAGKSRAKKALRQEMGLPDGDGPLAVVVSRLTEQKGLDLLLEALPAFLARGGQIALLGTGSAAFESAWRLAAAQSEGVAVRIGYDERMSHLMIAGGDAILVPSRFEPCGLTQLYGLRYGTVPVVARTGGLADTVIDANDAALRAGVATGILHDPGSAEAVAAALGRLSDLFADEKCWPKVARNAMRHSVGWEGSATAYAALYRSLMR
ncbi:glycogen synthase GlgA [Palleronia sp. LCG004]|uniref:glycogen synthase GlgA n=1 Tax=Palleronia sp. LCG004 TaxID=3079304 RepID=UPI002943A49B|nr:glycogen synthase GlgA [Palleronia sp. LCG004]WOI54917.1 glycogen synthase GlgA [Palleronia sp. LCG004]